MATDPFDGVGILTQEIGQPTFVELIYTERRTGKSIKPRKPNVADSLPQIAFKRRQPLGSHDPSHPSTVVAVPQHPKQTYSLSPTTIQNLSRQNIITNGFMDLVKNSIIPQDVNCAITTLSGVGCPSSGCQIDIVFVVDTSASMSIVIADLKSSILKIINQLDVLSGNYRFGLVTFTTAEPIVLVPVDIGCISNSSSNTAFAAFTVALNSIVPSGGGIPTNSDGALQTVIDGGSGLWRTDSNKVIVLITDNLPGGSIGVYDVNAQANAKAIALNAGACGINIVAINCGLGVKNSTLQAVMENYSKQSNGLYIENVSGTNISAYIASFLRNLCEPITTDYQNEIINGSFDTSIAGWQITGSASWSSVGSNGFMVLTSGSKAEQTISNLMPGDRVQLRLVVAGVPNSGNVLVGLNDQNGVQPVSGGLNIYSGATIERDLIVPPSGIVTVTIHNQTVLTPIYVDNVNLYQISESPCGFGTRNLVSNSEFETGVSGWTDTNNVQLPSAFWDSSAQAIIIGTAPVRYSVNNLQEGQNLVLMFDAYDNQPSSNDNLELVWVAKDADGVIIATDTLINATTTYPTNITASLTIPIGFIGPLYIEFTSGGTGKIKSVYVCDPGGYCDAGMLRLSFDQFTTNRGGWAGGILTNGGINLDVPNSGNDILQQTYFELVPNTVLHLSVNCRTTGGIIVELFYTSNAVIDQFFTETSEGVKSFQTLVPKGATMVTVRIRSRTTAITVDDILLCQGTQLGCDGSITNLRTYIEWNGVPRSPTNIFNIVGRFTYRDLADPFKLTVVNMKSIHDGRWGLVTPTECNGTTTYDFWKQMGDAGVIEDSITTIGLFDTTLDNIQAGDVISLKNRRNWLWSIPASNTGVGQDGLVTLWDNPPQGLIQQIEFLILANNINSLTQTTPVCPGPFTNIIDPADSFDFIVRYRNSKGQDREFRKTFQLATLYQVTADYPSPPWDTISAIDHGVKGTNARWETSSFILDTVDGRGLDQCTKALFFSAVGKGTLKFKKFNVSGGGQSAPGCTSTVIVDEVTKGSSIDEVQSIALPARYGGRWHLTFKFGGVQNMISVPWNASAAQLRNLMAAMPLIQFPENLIITGTGYPNDPYIIQFTQMLGGQRLAMITVDASGLTGTGSAVVTQVVKGTKNEQQTITMIQNVTQLAVSFNGAGPTNCPIPASANTLKAALEALPSIGPNNVSVTTDADPDTAVLGPWRVQFIGTLSGQNVPDVVPINPSALNVVSDWQGGQGTNEIQRIAVRATEGTYLLQIPNPNPTGGFVITGQIAFNASAADVAAAITAAADWLVGNIKVTKLPHNHNIPDEIVWTVEFKGVWAGIDMPIMSAISIGLRDTLAVVTETTRGGGVSERQRIQVIDSNFGIYTLNVTIYNTTFETAPLLWNASADTVQSVIAALPLFFHPNDVSVTTCATSTPLMSSCYLVSFHPRFGDVELMTIKQNNLSCNPLGLGYIKPPPYQLELPECETPSNSVGCDILCTPGPLLCKPGPGDLPTNEEPCCADDNIADGPNVYTELILQRELFDPYQRSAPGKTLTIKDLAVLRGLKPANFNAYLRNFITGTLTPIDFITTIETKMSVVLILKDEDTAVTRKRIARQLQTSNNILPSRMVWESLSK